MAFGPETVVRTWRFSRNEWIRMYPFMRQFTEEVFPHPGDYVDNKSSVYRIVATETESGYDWMEIRAYMHPALKPVLSDRQYTGQVQIISDFEVGSSFKWIGTNYKEYPPSRSLRETKRAADFAKWNKSRFADPEPIPDIANNPRGVYKYSPGSATLFVGGQKFQNVAYTFVDVDATFSSIESKMKSFYQAVRTQDRIDPKDLIEWMRKWGDLK